jgi:hypothetical protein
MKVQIHTETHLFLLLVSRLGAEYSDELISQGITLLRLQGTTKQFRYSLALIKDSRAHTSALVVFWCDYLMLCM